ncbi:uncharacterized protein A4U43_C05F6160 [Asparagus officinalis]|uniref:Uncharacterized protein n=1 Tax=Asparagus officinalis TaxID=4686 RepID=A0A5P1EU34_ASPOF|nr:uncharacterized protein A4U43_C05F6160 [Asparagus officinalis]
MEQTGFSDAEKEQILKEAISEVKANTVELIKNQLEKIRRLRTLPGWDIHRIDATEAFRKRESPEFPQAWNAVAREPSITIVEQFLKKTV